MKRVGMVLSSVMLSGACAPCVLAQGGNPPGWTAPTTYVWPADVLAQKAAEAGSWDFADPQNQAELRQWAALYWSWWEVRNDPIAGPVAKAQVRGFVFTNPMPRWVKPLDNAFALFRHLYRSRLNLGGVGPDFVDIDQLLQSDSDVMMRFQIYTVTGELKSSVDDGADVLLNHLNGVLTADGPNSAFKSVTGQLIQTTPGAGLLVTTNVVANDKSETDTNPSDGMNIPPTLPPVVHPAPEEIIDEILRVRTLSGLANRGFWHEGPGGLYIPDCIDTNGNGERDFGEPAAPGFDCDDFTEAFLEFSRRNLFIGESGLSIYFEQLAFTYFKKVVLPNGQIGEEPTGHAVALLTIRGKFYIVDPQGGRVIGPVDPNNLEAVVRQLVNQMPDGIGGPNVFRSIHRSPPGVPWYGENDPWWTNPDVRDRIVPRLPFPPAYYIPNQGFPN